MVIDPRKRKPEEILEADEPEIVDEIHVTSEQPRPVQRRRGLRPRDLEDPAVREHLEKSASERALERSRGRWDQPDIDAVIAKTRSGRILLEALQRSYPGDTPKSDDRPQEFLTHFVGLRNFLDTSPAYSRHNKAEKIALLLYCAAELEQELGVHDAPPLPATAPQLWADRDPTVKTNPPTFVRQVYGPWIARGLTRRRLNDLDPALYNALTVWEHRHAEQRMTELPTLAEEIDARIASLSKDMSPDELRTLGLTLQTRHRRKKTQKM
jgi:hypothetical protein